MKIAKRGLEKMIRELVNVDSMQYGLMPGRETTNISFVVR